MSRQQLKEQAKTNIKGKIGMLFVISLIMSIVSGLATLVLGLIPFVGPIAAMVIITPAFALSTVMIYLNIFNNAEIAPQDAFLGFNDFWSAFKVQFLVGLFTFLWSLLFVIPGIIKAISYSQSMYILAENKGMSALECISKSKAMMEGHKMDYFVLGLSFIGWNILAGFTFGILYIWLVPYMSATNAGFYKMLTSGNAQ